MSLYSSVRHAALKSQGTITTGDSRLDKILGGGIRCGVITELVGERFATTVSERVLKYLLWVVSASGKTQFALQISLLVQLPVENGGLSGSTCYLTTHSILPTPRLLQMAQEHEFMTPEICNLKNVHTRSMTSIPELRHIVSQGIPNLIQHLSSSPSSPSLRLLVLDSMSALFHANTKTTSQTLFERSRDVADIALMLHQLASMYHLAILVINEVNSVFERIDSSSLDLSPNSAVDQMLYSQQARWFSRGDSHPSERLKEAGLGLVWASQIGLRVLMTQTGRRNPFLASGENGRQRDSNSNVDRDIPGRECVGKHEAPLIRRLSVLFSTFSPPDSIDFIILRSGITSISACMSA